MIFTCAQHAIEEADFLANYNQMPYAICVHSDGFLVTPHAFTDAKVLEVCKPSKKLSELYA